MKKIPKEALDVLRQAADEMSNNGCNDFMLKDTPSNRKFIIAMMSSKTDEEFDIEECISDGEINTTDWLVLDYIGDLIEESIK